MMPTEVIAESININIGDIIATSIFGLLVILFFVSFAVFIKNCSKNQKRKARNHANIEQKLDKIIALLEKKEIDKRQ